MNSICLLSILLAISTSQHHFPSPKLRPLRTFISHQGRNEDSNKLITNADVVLPNGRYHVSNYEITSTTINLNGKQSSIFPSSSTNDEDFSEHSESNGFADKKENSRKQLFRISNSTTWMSELTFECGSAGSSIATISGSYVRIVGSHVISNSERTPLVIAGGYDGKTSSVTIIDSLHTSSCFPSLLPLTSLETSDSWTTHNSESRWLGTEVFVTGSEISVCDACLVGGTGPLFDFSKLPPTKTGRCSITTTLSSTLLLNTTSDCGNVDVNEGRSDFGTYETVSQKMIGSCVSSCTNHLSGTAIRDQNLGGSILCSNTSFTHCTTTTEYPNQHFTTWTKITTADTLHHFSLCTFKACTSSTDGGAISLFQISADLKIDSCSFESCSAPDATGGAINSYPSGTSSSIVISSSSFVKCWSSRYSGGSIYLKNIQSLAISDCLFLDSRTASVGGGIYLNGWNSQTSNSGLSNCLFQNCVTTDTNEYANGGAIYFDNCLSIKLGSVSFRVCKSGSGNGNDLYFYKSTPSVTTTTVSNCDSTSTPNNKRIYPTNIAVGDVLPTPSLMITIKTLVAQSTSSTTAEIVVTLNKTVTGTLLVLVSNSEEAAQPAGKAPNIGRVLVFSIQSSTIGQCVATVGDAGLLQRPLSDYKIVSASLSKHTVSFSGVRMSVITHPTFISADCDLDESHTHAILNLEGFDLEDGLFKLTLQNGTIIEASFTDNEAAIDLGMIGGSSGWMENEEFEIKSGKNQDGSIVVSIPSQLSFKIPLAARIIDIEVSDLNDAQTGVTLSFSSRLLKANQEYDITIRPKDGSGDVVMDVTTDSTGSIADETVILSRSSGNGEGWKKSLVFGEEYEVIGVSAKTEDGDYPTLFSPILLSMPLGQVQVKEAGCSTDQPATTIVWISGSGLIPKETYTLTLSGTPSTVPDPLDIHARTITVVASSPTEAQSATLPLSTTSDFSLLFGHTYAITAITNGSLTGIVEGTPSFTTRSTPTLTSISCDLKVGDPKTAEISIVGSDIPNGDYRLVLKNKVSEKETELKIEIAESEGNVEIDIFSSSSLEYGATYEVLSMSSSSLTVALPTDETKRLVKVPDAPARVRSASCLVGGSMKTLVDVEICGENLPVGETLIVKVKEVGSGGSPTGLEIELPDATIASAETTTIEIELYGESNPCLKYGTTYEITSITISGSLPTILDESVRFYVPCEPVRITKASFTTPNPAKIVVSVEGSGFVFKEFYTVSVSGHPTDSSSSPPHPLHETSFMVTAMSPEKATSSPLQLDASDELRLKFSYSYLVVGMTNGTEHAVIDGGQFDTPSQPSLTSISCTLKVGDPKTAEISIVGSDIPNAEYHLALKNKVSEKETELKIEIASSTGQVEIVIVSSSSLEYGTTYEVLSLSSSSLTVALPKEEVDRLVKVPDAPARVQSASCLVGGSMKTLVEVEICGENLPVGETLSVKVKEVGSAGSTTGSEIGLSPTQISSDESTTIEIELFGVSNPCLEYGKTYEITSIAISGSLPTILDESVRFSVPCEPVRITKASCTETNPDRTVVTVEGSGFVLGELYTVSVSGQPTDSSSTPSSSLHNTSFVVTASTSKEATSSLLQLYPFEGSQLKFSYSYTIVGISYGSVKGVVDSVVFKTQHFIERDDALITKIEAVPANSLNTSITIEVSGTNLPSDTVGKLTLNDSFSFVVSFSSSSFGRSAVIELGVSGSLAFGSEYEITTLEDSHQKTIQMTKTTFSTPPKPSQLSMCVCGKDETTGMEMSGADPETCSAIKSAWNTATSLGILDTTMRIVDSADLSSPLIVTTRVPFILISFKSVPASFRSGPLASQPSSALISVEEGALCRLTLLTISADLSVSTFKLVSAEKGTVEIRSCSIEGTRHSESNSEDVSICGWSSGLIELIESDTELIGVTMTEIVVGGIWMSGGKLTITKSDFSQNGPSITDFPSTRQNIHCEGEGTISIDQKTTDETDSMWIDADECTIDGSDSLIASPLFVPTLNSAESKVETDKNGEQTVKVVGKTLMPCGLSLEVFEWDSSKNVEGKSDAVDLSTSTATHWNESEIHIPFSAADVPQLNKKMEWRGRLVFGNGVRTENWMVVSGLGSGNKSEGGIGSKWWIPVIICLSCALLVALVIVVCVCMHRKRNSPGRVLLKSEEMSPAQVEEDEKMEENDHITNPPNSAFSSVPSGKVVHDTLFEGTRYSSGEGIAPAQSYVEVIVCNESLERSVAVETDTLFNALHNAHSTRFVEKRKVGQAVAKGLANLAEMRVIADVLTHLSPHWVLFDKNDRVSLKTRERQSVVGESGVGEVGKKATEDGQRWMAPEVGQDGWQQTKENADHGAVFSLGLVLWEIETGVVPFGEVDGAAAQRRLASDEKPRMEKVSDEMQAIIVPCLSLDPSLRPTLKTVLSQLDELDGVPQTSNEKEGHAMSHVG